MSKRLADLLGNDHPLFSYNLQQLEKAAGGSAIDARLLADVLEKAHTVMRQLGLDPADTSAQELYGALNEMGEERLHELLADTLYVLLPTEGEPISFNVADVIENAHHQLPLDHRVCSHAQRYLRMEVVKRYAELERTDTELVHRLAREIGLLRDEDSEHPPLLLTMGTNQKEKEMTEDTTGNKPRVLAIGDIFTDAFIELPEESAKVIKEADGKEWLALPFGQKPPYDHVDIVRSVGPSPNAAVSMARLGLAASLMGWVGGDDTGREALAHLEEENVATGSMVTEPDNKTSYWYVLRYGADRTMLVRSEKYKYEWRDPAEKPDWIYLSYIGELSWDLHENLLQYLDANPDVKLAFQPGTFHFKWGVEKLAGIYRRSHIVILNREEAVDITGASYDSIQDLANGLHELGPEKVVITDGPNGSYASYDYKLVTIANYPDPAEPLDRTGAGDAFASTIVAALALGESMDTALTWAPINSMNVVQHLGAQAGLLKRADIQGYLEKAPEDYGVHPL